MYRARRLGTQLHENVALGDSETVCDGQSWSRTLRLLFLVVAATAAWAVPLLLIDLLAS